MRYDTHNYNSLIEFPHWKFGKNEQKKLWYLLIPRVESSFWEKPSRNCACQCENYQYFHRFFCYYVSQIWIYTIKGYFGQIFNINNHQQYAREWRFVLKTDFLSRKLQNTVLSPFFFHFNFIKSVIFQIKHRPISIIKIWKRVHVVFQTCDHKSRKEIQWTENRSS